ncbi:MAG: hypothetical protein ACJAR2_000042 [Ilumatobacter sp.]|jgi:hypothetical protein
MTDPINQPDGAHALVAGPYITSLRVPPELRELVSSTLQDLLVVDDRPTPYSAVVEIEPEGTYWISADGRVYRSALEARRVPDGLVRMLLLAELDAHPERLHLHAGAVADHNRGVVIAGFSGSGKSTLVTSLVRAGFDYLTDERVAIDTADLTVSGFPKPISLVGGSFEVFPDLHPTVLGHGQATDTEWQIPASAIGTGALLTEMNAQVVVFVNYEEGSDVSVERVHPVTAVGRLLHDSPDIARFGGAALRVCGQLCVSTLCVEVTYSEPSDVGPAIRALLDESDGGISSFEVEIFTPEGAPTTDEVRDIAGADLLARSSAHTFLLIDGRALAHSEHDQELVELDESGSAWLMLVDGVSTVDDLIEAVHAETGLDRSSLELGARRALGDLADRRLVSRIT